MYDIFFSFLDETFSEFVIFLCSTWFESWSKNYKGEYNEILFRKIINIILLF